MSDERLTEEMLAILGVLLPEGSGQFPAVVHLAVDRMELRNPSPLDSQRLFHALQELLGLGYVVPGKDLQRPIWPWLSVSDRGRRAAERYGLK
ncbi:MAG: hypothetical protein HUU35_19515 [Armatimonadetes bacterium]|nr:hypothetical protein [Armatimonadota bacterium]